MLVPVHGRLGVSTFYVKNKFPVNILQGTGLGSRMTWDFPWDVLREVELPGLGAFEVLIAVVTCPFQRLHQFESFSLNNMCGFLLHLSPRPGARLSSLPNRGGEDVHLPLFEFLL